MEFLPVLEFHHVKGNDELNHKVLRALDTGIVGWVMDCPDPSRGMFPVEVLCVVCHLMHHEAGACPHRRKEKARRAA